jgi:hypothetical protein
MSIRLGRSRTCFRREKLLRGRGATTPLLKCGSSLGKRLQKCGELQANGLRPEPASLPKQDKPAQGLGCPWRSTGKCSSVNSASGVEFFLAKWDNPRAVSSQIAGEDREVTCRTGLCGGLLPGAHRRALRRAARGGAGAGRLIRVHWNRLAGTPAGFADGVDDGTTYAVSAPVVLSGTTIGLQSAGCPAGGIWKWGGTGWVCHPDLDTNSGGDITGVIAGTGLVGGGSAGSVTLSLAATPVTQDSDGYARMPVTAGAPPAADCNSAGRGRPDEVRGGGQHALRLRRNDLAAALGI